MSTANEAASTPLSFITVPTEDGPLYPGEAFPTSSDLTNDGKAAGDSLWLYGRVLNFRQEPVSGAVIEIWQADHHGYYKHPRAMGPDALDPYWEIGPDQLDPNFLYFSSVASDPEGRYLFKTIMPRWYHVFGIDRAAHIHIKVRSQQNGVLTTEIYFPGTEQDQIRERDRVFQGRTQKSDLITALESEVRGEHFELSTNPSTVYCRHDLVFL